MLVLSLIGCLGGGPWDGTWLIREEYPGTQENDCAPNDDDPVTTEIANSILDIYTTGDGEAMVIAGGIILKGTQDRKTLNIEYAENDEDYDREIELDAVRNGKVISGTVSSYYEAFDPVYVCNGETDFTGSSLDDTSNHLD